jgi:hypothetical protein
MDPCRPMAIYIHISGPNKYFFSVFETLSPCFYPLNIEHWYVANVIQFASVLMTELYFFFVKLNAEIECIQIMNSIHMSTRVFLIFFLELFETAVNP